MPPPGSDSTRPNTRISVATGSTAVDGHAAHQRVPRSLPSWIQSFEVRREGADDDGEVVDRPPPRAVRPQHNSSPSEPPRRVSRDGYIDTSDDLAALNAGRRRKIRLQYILQGKNGPGRGRKWDHLRSAEPVIISGHLASKPGSPWRDFVQSSRYGHLPNEEAEIVGVDVLDRLQPRFNYPADVPRLLDSEKPRHGRRKTFSKRVWSIILTHPLVPLAFRLTVLLTTIIALALAVRIYQIEHRGEDTNSAELAQAVVALVVDTVAIPYIGYMTWDEYTGKPLGLRPPTQKISLVLMDLFFIIFKSASTSLAFEAFIYHNSSDRLEKRYSMALSAFQTVSLISWTMTLAVNVFRLVQKLGGGEEQSARMWDAHGIP